MKYKLIIFSLLLNSIINNSIAQSEIHEEYFKSGKDYFSKNDFTNAIIQLNKYIDLNKNSLNAFVGVNVDNAYFLTGVSYFNTVYFDKAKIYFDGLLARNGIMNQEKYNAYSFKGYMKFLSEDYSAAILDFTNAINSYKKNDDAFLMRGICNFRLNKKDEATSDFTKVLEAKTPTALNAYALYYSGKPEEAITLINKLLTDKPTNYTYYYAACIYALNNNKKEAFENLEIAMKNGFIYQVYLFKDKSIDNLRDSSAFSDLITKYSIIKPDFVIKQEKEKAKIKEKIRQDSLAAILKAQNEADSLHRIAVKKYESDSIAKSSFNNKENIQEKGNKSFIGTFVSGSFNNVDNIYYYKFIDDNNKDKEFIEFSRNKTNKIDCSDYTGVTARLINCSMDNAIMMCNCTANKNAINKKFKVIYEVELGEANMFFGSNKVISITQDNDTISNSSKINLTLEECRNYEFIFQPPMPPLYVSYTFKTNGTYHYSATQYNSSTNQELQNEQKDGTYKVIKKDKDYKYVQCTIGDGVENVLISLELKKMILNKNPVTNEVTKITSN
jgi:hypothetical protein